MAIFAFINAIGYSQIGIGTTTPDASSILDMESTTQGFRSPRMTSTQRLAIASPANGLMVFDTTVGSFYHYDSLTSSWIRMSGTKEGRLKYKLIKSSDVLADVLAAEKTAGSNTKYLLDSGTLYEINGIINLDLPIELNNAYIMGEDSGDDRIVMSANGDMFTGTTGGSIRVLTLTKNGGTGSVFNITGPGAVGAQTQPFILRDCTVSGCTVSLGSLNNFSFVFLSIVQFAGNTGGGITYNNINRLLLSNTGWFTSNVGTFERMTGTFGLIQKQGGFFEVNGTNIGLDVSSNPTVTEAVMESTVFTGTPTGAGKFVNPYTTGTFTGFNFNNNWSVRCTGIPNEGDSQTSGSIYMNRAGTAQTATPVGTLNTDTKLTINSILSSNLYRTTNNTTNRITYAGKKGRVFQVNAAISFGNVTGSSNTEYLFFIMKTTAGGVTEVQSTTETLIDTNAGYIQSFPIQGSVYLNTGDYVEVFIRRLNQTNATAQSFVVRSFNLTIK